MATPLWAILIVISSSVIGGLGQYFFKKASGHLNLNPLQIIKNTDILKGVFVYALGAIIWILILPYGELSTLYPFIAIVYIWVSIIAKKYFNEEINKFKIMGIAFIILGVVLVGLGY